MSRSPTPPATSAPARPLPDDRTGPAAALPDGSAGLALIKPAVRAQSAYILRAPPARRKLNQNECPLDLPPPLKRAILDAVAAAPWQRYPEFVPGELLERLAAHYRWRPDGILAGNGSNELIQATLSVTLGAGDAVVAPSPTFSLYRLLTGVLGGRYIGVPLGADFEYDVDRLISNVVRERARVIVLNSPNNPTGSALPAGAVERILRDTEALVVCDEAYAEFGGPSAIPLLARSSRLVVLRTFSKAMGLAGLRFGVALAHPEVTAELAKGKLPYNVNLVTLAAAAAALREGPLFAERTRQIVATRDRFVARLATLSGITVYPTAANFVLFRCRTVPAREVFRRLYDEYGILVRDVSNAGELTECLRISIGTDDDMDADLAAMAEIFGRPNCPA
ncbi:MAG: histidinol-phosphate transaminase [Gemmatimonadales bacterium]|nr:histidinol-phosphate transaminase [Gemmatimonadales bacterium]